MNDLATLGTTLIISSNNKKKEQEISKILKNLDLKKNTNNPDILEIDREKKQTSIGISQAKKGIAFLKNKPFSNKHKILIIKNANSMTVQAQNALLKTLEEPPEFAKIVLTAREVGNILETVLSRCKIFNLQDFNQTTKSDVNEQKKKDSIEILLTKEKGERLSWVEKYSKKDREVVVKELGSLLKVLRESIRTKINGNHKLIVKDIELVSEIMHDLKNTNVNMRLALENLAINIH